MESPAGRCHYHIWYHLFRTISLPYPQEVYKMGNGTNSFRKFGIKRRIQNFSHIIIDSFRAMWYDDSVGAFPQGDASFFAILPRSPGQQKRAATAARSHIQSKRSQRTDYSLSAATRRPEKMTLGDSVNIVKGHFHSVLVSNILVTSLSVGSVPGFTQWLNAKLVSFRRIFSGSVLALIILGALDLPVHWYHLFVLVYYHRRPSFSRRDIP